MNSYAQIADVIARFPPRDLIQLTSEDPTAQNIDFGFLQTALDDAADEIDTYLESRFALPFTSPPRRLTRSCCIIAVHNLQTLRPIHDLKYIDTLYQNECKFLNEVSEGQLTLGIVSVSGADQEPADPSNPAVVFVEAGGIPPGEGVIPHRVFSRGKMIGF